MSFKKLVTLNIQPSPIKFKESTQSLHSVIGGNFSQRRDSIKPRIVKKNEKNVFSKNIISKMIKKDSPRMSSSNSIALYNTMQPIDPQNFAEITNETRKLTKVLADKNDPNLALD
jgi:hypothetical protein